MAMNQGGVGGKGWWWGERGGGGGKGVVVGGKGWWWGGGGGGGEEGGRMEGRRREYMSLCLFPHPGSWFPVIWWVPSLERMEPRSAG